MWGMKLSESNPYLRSPKAAAKALWVSVKTSSAIEGIRHPFATGPDALKPPTTAVMADYRKQRASKSGR